MSKKTFTSQSSAIASVLGLVNPGMVVVAKRF